MVVQPVGDLTLVDALHGHRDHVRPRGGRRNRVASPDYLAVDRNLKRDKLPRKIAEQPWRVGDEAEGFDVVGLLDNLDTADRQLAGPTEQFGAEIAGQQRAEIGRRQFLFSFWLRLRLNGGSSRRPPYKVE